MRIVHLCSYIQPPLGYQEYYLAKEHAKMGYEVIVVSSDRYYPFPKYNRTVKKILGKRIIGRSDSMYDGFRLIRLGISFELGTQIWLKSLEKVIRRIKPDIVICHEMTHFNSIRIAKLKKELSFRLIYDNHGSFICDSDNILKRVYNAFFDYNTVKENADKIIGVTEGCVEYIAKKFNIPSKKIEMIPLGADIDLFCKDDKKRVMIRNKYKIDKDDFVIIYTGKVIKKKGVHLILEALNKIDKKKGIKCLIVGNGDNEYIDYIDSLGNKYNIKVIKIDGVPNRDLPAYYLASDIAVWPIEATIGTIEAMACALPIICNKDLNERYENGNGFGVNPWNIEELAEKIDFFIKNDLETIKMGNLSRKIVVENLSWNVIAKKFLE
jgi:glycosyltransferase involved in cell wall biosynthesis